MAKFQMNVTLNDDADYITARVADGTGDANQLKEADVGKLLKLAGDSRYGLCADGDEIEGVLETAEEMQRQDGYSIGTVRTDGRIKVALAEPVAVGEYVVSGAPLARGTAQNYAPPAVKKAAKPAELLHKWRVISILSGTGAAGSIGVIERV